MENNIFVEQDKYEIEKSRNIRKMILIENFYDLGLTDKKRREFLKFYYDNLDEMTLLEALDEFKKI